MKEKALVRLIISSVVFICIGFNLIVFDLNDMPPIYGILCGVEFWTFFVLIYSVLEYVTTNEND